MLSVATYDYENPDGGGLRHRHEDDDPAAVAIASADRPPMRPERKASLGARLTWPVRALLGWLLERSTGAQSYTTSRDRLEAQATRRRRILALLLLAILFFLLYHFYLSPVARMQREQSALLASSEPMELDELRDAIQHQHDHPHVHDEDLRAAGAPTHGRSVRHLALPGELFRSDRNGVPGILGEYESAEDFNRRAPGCRRLSRPELESGQVVLFANESLTACFSLATLEHRLGEFLERTCSHPVLCQFACLTTFFNETGWELPCMCSLWLPAEGEEADQGPRLATLYNADLAPLGQGAEQSYVVKEKVAYLRDLREQETKRILLVPQRLTGTLRNGVAFESIVYSVGHAHTLTHMMHVMRGRYDY